jgi:hypothetical protein
MDRQGAFRIGTLKSTAFMEKYKVFCLFNARRLLRPFDALPNATRGSAFSIRDLYRTYWNCTVRVCSFVDDWNWGEAPAEVRSPHRAGFLKPPRAPGRREVRRAGAAY